MPVKLLESGSKRTRSPGGAVTSAALHTALILGAVYATAHARPEAKQPPTSVRTVYFPPRSTVPSPPTRHTSHPVSPQYRVVDVRDLPPIDVKTPQVDLSISAVRPEDFAHVGVSGAQADGAEGARGNSTTTFRADEVERQASLVRGSAPPEYPEVLRRSGVEGTVVATFIVGVDGRAETDSVRFARSDNALFDDAVRTALKRMRFVPAEVAGRKVRQLVQMPFVFTLAK